MSRIAGLLIGLLVVSCGPAPAPQPPTPSVADCSTACAHLRALGCPDGQPTPAGTSCEAVCEDTVASGLVRLDVACLAQVPTCAAELRCSH